MFTFFMFILTWSVSTLAGVLFGAYMVYCHIQKIVISTLENELSRKIHEQNNRIK